LSARFDEPLPETLRRAACEVADRFDVPVELLAQDAVDATQTEREALVRIVREAVTNAVKHGNAKRVLVEVAAAPRRLVVRDDGHGFDPARHGRGFGLVSMRDRAEGLGGRLVVDSTPGAGTAVEVTW
jgi:signal transduction histidine kinase